MSNVIQYSKLATFTVILGFAMQPHVIRKKGPLNRDHYSQAHTNFSYILNSSGILLANITTRDMPFPRKQLLLSVPPEYCRARHQVKNMLAILILQRRQPDIHKSTKRRILPVYQTGDRI